MGAKAKASLGAILAVSLLLGSLVLALTAIGCAMYDRGSNARMTLDSGMDKKVSPGYRNEGAAGGEAYSQSEGMMLPSRDSDEAHSANAAMEYPGAAPQAPTSTGGAAGAGTNVISDALAGAGISEDLIDNWIAPKAYAADHGENEQYLVRTGDVSLEVDDYEDTQTKIAAIADDYKGYVSDSQSQHIGDQRIEGWVKIRVPADDFFSAWEDVRTLGSVENESISTNNVSREYLANHSQMKNLLAQQATLQDMLKEAIEVQRKHGLGEGRSLMLDVQERLFNVTSQLQAVEDRQNALADLITMSTITAHLTEVKEVGEVVGGTKDEWNWGTNRAVDDSVRELRGRLKNLWTGLIWFGVTCWTWLIPLLFWVAVLWFIYRKWVRPQLVKLAKQQPKPAASTADGGEIVADDKTGKPDE